MLKVLLYKKLFDIYIHFNWFYLYTPEFYSVVIGVLFS